MDLREQEVWCRLGGGCKARRGCEGVCKTQVMEGLG